MRRGFTLIEIMIVLAIMSLIGGCSVVSIRYYKVIKNKVDSDFACNAVVSFINNSKMYCRENSCTAYITFDMVNKKMFFNDGMHIISKLVLTNKIKSYQKNSESITIDNLGFTSNACTFSITDNNGNLREITMRVGTEYVKITK